MTFIKICNICKKEIKKNKGHRIEVDYKFGWDLCEECFKKRFGIKCGVYGIIK